MLTRRFESFRPASQPYPPRKNVKVPRNRAASGHFADMTWSLCAEVRRGNAMPALCLERLMFLMSAEPRRELRRTSRAVARFSIVCNSKFTCQTTRLVGWLRGARQPAGGCADHDCGSELLFDHRGSFAKTAYSTLLRYGVVGVPCYRLSRLAQYSRSPIP
jgi:hypothetical protein